MPAPTKRSRTDPTPSPEEMIDAPPTPTPTPTPSSSGASSQRRFIMTLITPTRPTLTRSATTELNTPAHLTRSSSLVVPTRLGLGGIRGGTLFRTQSLSSVPSPAQVKAGLPPGGSGVEGKGEGLGFDGEGAKRWGKGKENIPPRKDEENGAQRSEDGSRKRLRVGRTRSGSVVSMRSEGGDPRSSVAPSSSSSFSKRSRLPSPSPSLSSTTTRSFDSITSVDPLDVINDDEDMEMDKTPTKPRPSRATTFPTPPPSSPMREAELDAAAKRIELIRMKSDVSSTSSRDSEMELLREKSNPYKQLKAFLRLSAANNSPVDQRIIGREQEKATLRTYLKAQSGRDVGMYISGPPGTGKTALVTALGRGLASEGWQVAELGCMGLKIGDVWRRLGEALGCGKTESDVQASLSRSGTRNFIILDEIDSLLPSPPSQPHPATSHLLTKLFSLPLIPNTKLIAISNTLDLTLRARLVLPDSLQPDVLPFKAYGGAEMIDIVNARIASASGLNDGEAVKVDAKAIELLTKKVEAQNGDLRTCLGVLASAVTLAETEWAKKNLVSESVIPLTKVALPHTIKAFNSHTQQLRAAAGSTTASTSATGRKIRSVPLQGKMVLVSILIFLSRVQAGLPGCPNATPTKSTSSETLSTSTLYATYAYILSHRKSPFQAASESDYRDLLSNLEVLGLISLGSTSATSGMSRSSSGSSGRARTTSAGAKIELCVREDEVKSGLGLEGTGNGPAEEEVGKVWEREDARILRAKEKAAALAAGKVIENDDPF